MFYYRNKRKHIILHYVDYKLQFQQIDVSLIEVVRDRYFSRAHRCCNLLKPLGYEMLASNSDHFHHENTFTF